MREFFVALGMAVSMFTVLPMPGARWEERLRPLSTALLPAVGLGIGLLWRGIAALAALLPGYLGGAAIAATPWLLTGFIHLDGFLDASDALLSWRPQEERRRILKDVHVGAFAAVSLMLLALFQFAAAMELKRMDALVLLPVLSRCGSARCALTMLPLGHSEYAGMEDKRRLAWIPAAAAALALAALALMCGWRGLAVGGCALAGYAAAILISTRTLGGFSGDLAGYALTVSELCGLIALAVFQG